MIVGVAVFPGSNCDRDCAHVIERVLGWRARMIWHQDRELGALDAMILPGGFSYGDHLRAGALAATSPVMDAVAAFAARGGPVLGVCNGFQILLERGLLPGAVTHNRSLRFVCRPQHVRCVTGRTAFTHRLEGHHLMLPIAHAEGAYWAPPDVLGSLWEHDQVAFQYVDAQDTLSDEANPNGSLDHIAGVCNRAGNVVGLMPHPERASEAVMGGVGGRAIFEAVASWLG